ncbi:MAG: STAS/SEC14 domain-containing protein [Rhodobacteraceae bacterium]|nr:STAS/SEC14 domain-containing protein [Paracoccaceae bacterium]
MIEVTSSPDDTVFEFRASGTVTEADYRDVLVPALDSAIEAREHIRLLGRFGADFDGYTAGAMFEDGRLGLKHWRGFERAAIVTDTHWISAAVKAFSVFMPCPVATFSLGEEDDARRWLRESLGSIHHSDLGQGVLHVRLLGQLDGAAYADVTEDLNAFIRGHDRFRLLLDLREFDGWQGLGALAAHFTLVRDHQSLLDRAAIVGDKAWQALAERIGRQFIKAPVRYFPADDFEQARAWLLAD